MVRLSHLAQKNLDFDVFLHGAIKIVVLQLIIIMIILFVLIGIDFL